MQQKNIGRIFMPFQTLPKDFRDCLKIKAPNNKFYSIKELFDLKCCFVQLSTEIAKQQLDPLNPDYDQLYNEFELVRQTAEADIYTAILNYINNPELTRLDIKKHIMLWLFSRNSQRQHINNPIVQAINTYFKHTFPNYYKFIIEYPVVYSDNNQIISRLSLDCFQVESQLFFEDKLIECNKNNIRII